MCQCCYCCLSELLTTPFARLSIPLRLKAVMECSFLCFWMGNQRLLTYLICIWKDKRGFFPPPLKSIAKRNSCHELSIKWFPSRESLLPFIFHYPKIFTGSILITLTIPACLYGHRVHRCLGDRLLSAQRQGVLTYCFHFTAPNCGATA